MTEPNIIHFTVSIAQIKTMADGGLRFAFDAPESAIEAAAALMKVKQAGGVLEIAALPVIPARFDPLVKQLQEDSERMSVAFPGIEIVKI